MLNVVARTRDLTLKLGIAALVACGSLAGCATSDTRLGSEPEGAYDNSKANGHAFGTDGFMFRKEQKIRPANDFQFYFKHCSLSDERSYYSKTSYWCTEP